MAKGIILVVALLLIVVPLLDLVITVVYICFCAQNNNLFAVVRVRPYLVIVEMILLFVYFISKQRKILLDYRSFIGTVFGSFGQRTQAEEYVFTEGLQLEDSEEMNAEEMVEAEYPEDFTKGYRRLFATIFQDYQIFAERKRRQKKRQATWQTVA